MNYPDTAKGAIEYLKDETDFEFENPTAIPDPSVRGVWKVQVNKHETAIVYLAGYPDPFGKIRVNSNRKANSQAAKIGQQASQAVRKSDR